MGVMEQIDLSIEALNNDEIIKFRRHIGDDRYVCEWIFFVPYGERDIKPTRKVIALDEWADMRKIVKDVNNDYPAQSCTTLDPTRGSG